MAKQVSFINGVIMLIASPILLILGISSAVDEFGILGLVVGPLPGFFVLLIGFIALVFSRKE